MAEHESASRKRRHGEDWERKGHKSKKHERKKHKKHRSKDSLDGRSSEGECQWVEAVNSTIDDSTSTTPAPKRDDWMSVPFATLTDTKPEKKSGKSKEVSVY